MSFKIAVWPGDGIGPEVIGEALKILKKLKLPLEFTELDWNSTLYPKIQRCVPLDYLETLKKFDAVFLGALGNKKIAPEYVAVGPLLEMRKAFDQYVNFRPALLLPGVDCPLKNRKPFDIDILAIRENTEGEYTNLGGVHYPDTPNEAALQVNYFTRMGTERVVRYAFETARKRKRKKLTSITKSNALKYSMVLWDKVFEEVAKQYTDVESSSMYVDAAAMNFVRCPEEFDVIVSSNLFGDILTDLSAVIVGGLGFAGSANLNPDRKFPSMFEPVHGSAPDIAGKNIANPIAAIMSSAMMLDFLGFNNEAQRINRAVEKHLTNGTVKTPDRGGKNTTKEVAEDILKIIES